MSRQRSLIKTISAVLAAGLIALPLAPAEACTYIRLRGKDGSYHPARTMEWGAFDLKPSFSIYPRGAHLTAMTMPDGKAGARWTATYGFAGINLLGKPLFADVINEKALTIHLLYLPGFAEYQPYEPDQASSSIGPSDFMTYMVSQFATVAEVKAALSRVRVVPIVEAAIGFPAPVHFVVTDPSGAQMAVEYVGGKLSVYTETVSAMTNSPPYDWHLTNLRNYLNLRAVAWPKVTVEKLNLGPIGEGSGMIGLPGDFTPPSRFVRAVAFTQTARPTEGGFDTTREEFRILDNFNAPLEAVEPELPPGLGKLCCSATQYTVSFDPTNMLMYYHTDDDRTVRRIDLKTIDFGKLKAPYSQPLRRTNQPPVDDVTPHF